MIRLCVDCKAILGQCCPHCGDTTHKPASANGDHLACGACWKSFEQDSTTGGFCESCLEKRLDNLTERNHLRKTKTEERATMSGMVTISCAGFCVPLPPWPDPDPKAPSPKREG